MPVALATRREKHGKVEGLVQCESTHCLAACVEARCEEYCERAVAQVEWQGGRAYLKLAARRDDPPYANR